MTLSSFRKTSDDHYVPPRTPSPILRYVEPLTPTYPTATYKDGPLFPGRLANGPAPARQHYGWPVNNGQAGEETESDKEQTARARTASRSSRHANPNEARKPSHGSPIDALADVASSLAPSPLFAPPSAHALPPLGSLQPATRPVAHTTRHSHTASDGQGYRYNQAYGYGYEGGYGIDERPSKRARSEVAPSNQLFPGASRPATSHISQGRWSHGVEQVASDMYPTYRGRSSLSSMNANHDELDIAQVLLGLRDGSIDNSRSARNSISTTQTRHSNPPPPTWFEGYSAHMPMPSGSHYQPYTPVDGHNQSYTYGNQLPAPNPETTNRLPDGTGPKAANDSLAVQTHTPPEESFDSSNGQGVSEDTGTATASKKGKGPQGWPKGKPRGPRNKASSSRKSSKAGKAADVALAPSKEEGPDQLQSPQSLPAEPSDGAPSAPQPVDDPPPVDYPPPADDDTRPERERVFDFTQSQAVAGSNKRRRSFADLARSAAAQSREREAPAARAFSVPPDFTILTRPTVPLDSGQPPPPTVPIVPPPAEEVTICAGCSFSRGPSTGQKDQWIGCNGCQNWYHFACAGFKNAKEVSGVDKFFCRACKPKFGPTTFVRKSKRAHTAVDYAGLNEGVLRTSEDEYEHHYIQAIKDGTFKFQPETFPRMRPELVTAENFERNGGFKEPIVIPAAWNPRPSFPGTAEPAKPEFSSQGEQTDDIPDDLDYEMVPDDGQDLIDMVIPQGLTVRRVAELYGPDEKVEVIDVKSQEGEDRRWNMAKWADYYEEEGEKPVRNVISLEISHSKLGRLIRRPKLVRDLDLQDSVWPDEETAKGNFPKVQFYCLMSVADCYTDFHIDFGGSSVYYHIIKGKKSFFFIPPKKQHLKKYEDWCLSQAQNWTFLADETKECYRVDLTEGDTMLIPSGWIHAVWTPENSLVIGGNFLTRINYAMQIRIAEIEKNTKVARKFRYPHFQKVLWYTVIQYLHLDPLPQSVANLFYDGKQFRREKPIYTEMNKFGHNSDPGPENFNARYYGRSELEGLPDLTSYIFRTVMISHGRVEGITAEVRNAVTKSIPKTYGDPLDLIKAFAMWAAWKRGNEDIPQWAHPEAVLPEIGSSSGDKKLSNAALKKLERKSFVDAFRIAPERQSARQQKKAQETEATDQGSSSGPVSGAAQPAAKHTSTPKTSVLGPKRIACDACRKRRIRCKHKDEVVSPLAHSTPSRHERRPSTQMMTVVLPSFDRRSNGSLAMNGLKPDQLGSMISVGSPDMPLETPDSKRGRSKACLDCRRSKRRCIHDEYGNIDPVKAQEAPIPRGNQSAKKRRISSAMEEAESLKKARIEEPHPSISLPNGVSLSDQDVIPEGQDHPEQDLTPLSPHTTTLAPDVPMPDAPPVEAVSNVIDPMLEAYASHVGTIEEEVDQIVVNSIDPALENAPPANDIPPANTSDIALPTTETAHASQAVTTDGEAHLPGTATSEQPNGIEHSSPLTDLAASVSPQNPRPENTNNPLGQESPSVRHSSRQSRPVERYSSTFSPRQSQAPKPSTANNANAAATRRRTASHTPVPRRSGSKQPVVVTPARQRRQSNASVESLRQHSAGKMDSGGGGGGGRAGSAKPRAMSHASVIEEDEASMRLIRELMGEDRGLRRRGSR